MNKRKIAVSVGAAIVIIAIAAIVVYPFESTYSVKASGKIVGLGVMIYEDETLSTVLTFLDWGVIEPGETKEIPCYIQSLSNVPAYLTFETSEWQPINASDYIFLSWNYDNSTLQPYEAREVIFSLYVSEDISGIEEFSFSVTVGVVRE